MAILRFSASADNTITNAYEENLTTRGTGSNMGRSDILEVFSIFAQQSSNSIEKARILVQFPVTDIKSKRDSGIIPASGSVDFILKLYNAPHADTTPRDFELVVAPVTASWQEGQGLDMVNYSDLTYDQSGSNWINATGNFVSASATITALSKTAGQANTRRLLVSDSDGNSVNFLIDNSISTSTATNIAFGNANANATQFATNIAAAVNLAQAADSLNVVGSSDGATVTLKQVAEGLAGNSANDISGTAVSDSVVTIVSQFSGGDGKWASQGGDYIASEAVTGSFSTGLENLEVDVSDIVEDWIKGSSGGEYNNYGFGIFLQTDYENSTQQSFFTKKFFARESEFYYKRPIIEARWDSSSRDYRGNFFLSSSLMTAAQNLNTLYLYNRPRGVLTNIPSIGEDAIYLSIFSGSADNSAPSDSALILSADGTHVRSAANQVVTGGYVSTGVYSASFAFTGSSTLETIYDVWFSGSNTISNAAAAPIQFQTGSVQVKTQAPDVYGIDQKYVVSITNLKSEYAQDETARFRLYSRLKNWSPNIHTIAKNSPENLIIEDALYKVYRIVDGHEIVSFSTGSTKYSQLSYDVSGNYFDLEMSNFQKGYQYAIKFGFYNDYLSDYVEQPHIFKFRVV